MIDILTKEPLLVRQGLLGKFIRVEESQVPEVKALLDAHRVPYWKTGARFALRDGSWTEHFTLSRKADPQAVQRLLDSVA